MAIVDNYERYGKRLLFEKTGDLTKLQMALAATSSTLRATMRVSILLCTRETVKRPWNTDLRPNG